MKQHITKQQIFELSNKGRERLLERVKPDSFDLIMKECKGAQDGYSITTWVDSLYKDWKEKMDDTDIHEKKIYPLLSIGQMMEYLADKGIKELVFAFNILQAGEPADALWQAVKDDLEGDE